MIMIQPLNEIGGYFFKRFSLTKKQGQFKIENKK